MNIFSTKNKIIFLSVLALFSFGFFANPIEVNADGCSVTNAVFRSNAGNDPDNFYHDLNRPYIYVDIQTQGCQGNNILVSIFQSTFGFQSGSILAAHNLPVGVNASTTDNFTLQFIAGEDWCGINTSTYPLGGTSGPFWDCKYSLEITDDNGEHLFATGEVSDNMNLAGGSQLVYDCVAGIFDCDHYWTAVDPLVRPYETSNINDQFNTSDTIIPPPPLEDFYLAPLPGFSQGQSSDLGGFLRSLFTLLIVIAGILAFIMIVIGAITYATADAISGKSSGKEMIQDAILGLVLALGAWIILNTINPNLASNLGITIPAVSLDAPRPEWNNGNAAAGTNIASGMTLGGQPITQGMTWPSDSTQRQQLASAGITVVSSGNSDCTPTAGTPNCTSVYFEGPAASVIQQIITFKNSCGCDIVVTGGSEAWLHQTHGPTVRVVDLRATPSLNAYLNGLPGGPSPSDNFPTGKTINISGVGSFYAEPAGATGNTTNQHWHVTFQ